MTFDGLKKFLKMTLQTLESKISASVNGGLSKVLSEQGPPSAPAENSTGN